jgi:signal transduction histidine kinase
VWTNLIDNAIDALDGRGHIWLRTSLEGDHIMVESAEDGPGISPDLSRGFSSHSSRRKGSATGPAWGLEFIAYRIVVEDSSRGFAGDLAAG